MAVHLVNGGEASCDEGLPQLRDIGDAEHVARRRSEGEVGVCADVVQSGLMEDARQSPGEAPKSSA
ncbi:MAG: hypothetical protein AB7V44_31090 [Pseudonocardia sp.]